MNCEGGSSSSPSSNFTIESNSTDSSLNDDINQEYEMDCDESDGDESLEEICNTTPNKLSSKESKAGPKDDSENSKHPLMHSLVLYHTLQYLPVTDLLSCRLVCTTWDTEVCRLLRKNLTLEFHDICHINNFKQLMDDNLAISPRDVPFARISLRSTFRLGHDVAQDFFKSYGLQLRHIKIAKVGCDCGANFFQKLLFYQATNLTSLDLQIISAPIRLSPLSEYTDRYVRVKRVPRRVPVKWMLPNLTHLNLRHQLFYERPKFIEDLLEAVVNLEELTTDETELMFSRNCFVTAVLASKNRWRKLRRMQTGDMVCLSNYQISKIAEMGIPLEYLPLSFNIMAPNHEILNLNNLMALLTSLQKSLKRLDLFNHRPDVIQDLKSFPMMEKLEYLKVTNMQFPSSFLERLPNLKVLYVAHEEATLYASFFSLKISPHPSISEFGLYPCTTMSLANLKTWLTYWETNANGYCAQMAAAFPYLRTLTINGNDVVLKSICEKLPLLEELNIYGPITDEGITGIPNSKCQRMHDERDYGLVDSDELDGLKFIGDLSKLKKLTVLGIGSTPMLTEVSVFLGFVCCKDLVTLDVGDKHLTDLWAEEVKRMRGLPQPS